MVKELYRYVYRTAMYESTRGLMNDFHSTTFCDTFPIVRETTHTYFIMIDGEEKRVLKGKGKRFAHADKIDALKSLRARVRSRKEILEYQLMCVTAYQNYLNSVADEVIMSDSLDMRIES